MRFWRRNQYFLLTLAALVLSSVLVICQFRINESAHVQRLEDFILLQNRGDTKSCEWLYQRLVQELPEMSDKSLVDDLQRTGMIVDTKAPQLDNLVWKFHVGVGNELKHRSEKRIAAALRTAEKQ